jgi:hypothetical protein
MWTTLILVVLAFLAGFAVGALANAAKEGEVAVGAFKVVARELGDRLEEGQTNEITTQVTRTGEKGALPFGPVIRQNWEEN